MSSKSALKALNPSEIQDTLNPDIPLHFQIYVQLKTEIVEGMWTDGKDSYGEESIAKRYGVSIMTVRKALGRLTSEGLIYRRRGRRTEVLFKPNQKATEDAYGANPIGLSRPYKYKVLSSGVYLAPIEACHAFEIEAGSNLWQCHRLRILEGQPHSLQVYAQPPELGARHSLKDLQKLPMWQVMAIGGRKRAGVSRRIECRFPSAYIALHLGITTHDPVLVFTYISLDKDKNRTGWTQIYHHPRVAIPWEYMDYETGERLVD